MEIIPIMVVLICASSSTVSWWGTSALEFRIPGLGKMNLQFVRDGTTQGEADGQTETSMASAGQGIQNTEASTSVGSEDEDSEKKVTGSGETTTVESMTTLKHTDNSHKSNDNRQDRTTKAMKEVAEPSEATESSSSELSNEATEKRTTELLDNTTEGESITSKNETEKSTQENVQSTSQASVPGESSESTTQGSPNDPNNETTAKDQKSPEKPEPIQDATPEQKNSTTEPSDNDDFDMSDIWEDEEEPPQEFGREYDLDPKLLDSGNGLGDFKPKLELPPDMTKAMFLDVPAANGNATEQNATDEERDGEGSFFDRLKRFFNIANLVEELDTIPGKVQSLVDQFHRKKSNAVKKLWKMIDKSAEMMGNKISEAFTKLKASKEKISQQCLQRIQESFKQYEAALQQGIQPCFENAQSALALQEGMLKRAIEKYSQIVTDVQSCAHKLEGSSINTFVSSIFNVGSCTKKNIQSQIEGTLQPQMERLSQLLKRHESDLNSNMKSTGSCVKKQLQMPTRNKQQQELIADGKQCLESN
ncbi:uncharacterized protein LOC134203634 isoform X2 [Armigeres subalbatus]|uniref:uncharacterized protein LOC134203634 isoform X2 n=1 Tax=Armigeres subalbatus TaxID=124917 RepID=UPI002ED62B20